MTELVDYLDTGSQILKWKNTTLIKELNKWRYEGVKFECNVNVGADLTTKELIKNYNAIVLACGSEEPRDLSIPGRDLNGVHFAMDFLTLQNKMCEGDKISDERQISAKDKDVVVIEEAILVQIA